MILILMDIDGYYKLLSMGNSAIQANSFAENISKHVIIEKNDKSVPLSGLYIVNKDLEKQFP